MNFIQKMVYRRQLFQRFKKLRKVVSKDFVSDGRELKVKRDKPISQFKDFVVLYNSMSDWFKSGNSPDSYQHYTLYDLNDVIAMSEIVLQTLIPTRKYSIEKSKT